MDLTPVLGLRKPADADTFGQDDFNLNSNVLDLAPGISVMSTVARDALTAAQRPTGRVIWNTTTARLEQQTGTPAAPTWATIGGISQADADARYQALSGKGVANGYAPLGADSKVPGANLPSTTPTNDSAVVATSEGTVDTNFTDLTTAGPAVTVATGTKALVIISAKIRNDVAGGSAEAGFAISGATTLAASATRALKAVSTAASDEFAMSWAEVVEGLTAGSNTFTMKYRRPSATGGAYFVDRRISVIDMGS